MLRKYLGTLLIACLLVGTASSSQVLAVPSAPTSTTFTIGGTGDQYGVSIYATGSVYSTVVSNSYPDPSSNTTLYDSADSFYLGLSGSTGTNSGWTDGQWEVIPEYTFSVSITPQNGQTVTGSIGITVTYDFYQYEQISVGGFGGLSGDWVSAFTDYNYGTDTSSLDYADTTRITPSPVLSATSSYVAPPTHWSGGTTYYPSSTTWEDISFVSGTEHSITTATITCTAVPGNGDWEGTSSAFFIPASSGSGEAGAAIPISDLENYAGMPAFGGGVSNSENYVGPYPISVN